MSSWRIAADSGTTQNVDDGEVVSIDGGAHISTEVGGTALAPTVTISTDATSASTASKLMLRDASGFSNVATPSSGDSSTKIATTAFVQAALTGLLEFKTGFNANTGILADGSGSDLYSDVAIAVGDYYVVTVAGNFFGEAATPLTPGDSVIVQTAANAGASTSSDFIVVQSDTDLATLTTVGIGNVNASATSGIDVSYTSGTANLTIDVNEVSASTDTPNKILGTDQSNVTKTFTEAEFFQFRFKKLALDAAGNAAITRATGSGLTTYTIDPSNAAAFGGTASALNISVEVLDNSNGHTVYADVTREDALELKIIFTGTVTDSTYDVLLTNLG
jgi:hypothetical protein